VGAAGGAGALGGIIAGPIGALVAAGIVSILGLGDDFIGQAIAVAFQRAEDAETPPTQGQFQGRTFNSKISVNGGDQGQYDIFFDVLVETITRKTSKSLLVAQGM
jgi:hypothetical protein